MMGKGWKMVVSKIEDVLIVNGLMISTAVEKGWHNNIYRISSEEILIKPYTTNMV